MKLKGLRAFQLGPVPKMANSMIDTNKPVHRRSLWLDACRALAIFLVMLIHVVQEVYPSNELGLFQGSYFYAVAISLGRLGVPLFFLMTGWLVLGKNFVDARVVTTFYRKNFVDLIVTVELWIIVLFFTRLTSAAETGINVLIRQMLMLEDVPGGFWWYVPAIIPIYALLPILGVALKTISFRSMIVPFALVVLYGFLPRLLEVVCLACCDGVTGINSSLIGIIEPGIYIFYIAIGYGCRVCWRRIESISTPSLLSMLSLCVVAGAMIGFTGKIDLWYSDVSVLLGGISLFILIHRALKHKSLTKWATISEFLSRTSFAVYFLHVVILERVVARGALGNSPSINSIIVLLELLVSVYVLISFLWVLTAKAPRLRRMVFHG